MESGGISFDDDQSPESFRRSVDRPYSYPRRARPGLVILVARRLAVAGRGDGDAVRRFGATHRPSRVDFADGLLRDRALCRHQPSADPLFVVAPDGAHVSRRAGHAGGVHPPSGDLRKFGIDRIDSRRSRITAAVVARRPVATAREYRFGRGSGGPDRSRSDCQFTGGHVRAAPQRLCSVDRERHTSNHGAGDGPGLANPSLVFG